MNSWRLWTILSKIFPSMIYDWKVGSSVLVEAEPNNCHSIRSFCCLCIFLLDWIRTTRSACVAFWLHTLVRHWSPTANVQQLPSIAGTTLCDVNVLMSLHKLRQTFLFRALKRHSLVEAQSRRLTPMIIVRKTVFILILVGLLDYF